MHKIVPWSFFCFYHFVQKWETSIQFWTCCHLRCLKDWLRSLLCNTGYQPYEKTAKVRLKINITVYSVYLSKTVSKLSCRGSNSSTCCWSPHCSWRRWGPGDESTRNRPPSGKGSQEFLPQLGQFQGWSFSGGPYPLHACSEPLP